MRNDTQPHEEMGLLAIISAETEPAFRFVLPIPVIEVVHREMFWAERIPDRVELLARTCQGWMTQTGSKEEQDGTGTVDCFLDWDRAPAMLFWALACFSDPNLPLTKRQKKVLAFQTLEASTRIRRGNVRRLMSTVTTHALDYCWYFFVRLLILEYGMAVRADADPGVLLNIGLIQWHFSYLVRDLCQFHEMGWLTTESPRDDFEKRLIELLMNEPRLKPFTVGIIQGWEEIEMTGHEIQSLARVMGSRICFEVENQEAAYAGDAQLADEATVSARRRKQVLHQMFCLERAMTPESDDDQAWHHPLDYIENRAKSHHVVFLDTPIDDGVCERLSNGQKFQLALMERLASQGFRRWLFTAPEAHLVGIHGWLKDNGDSRSVKSLCDGVQQYLTLPSGRTHPTLRDVLMFPGAPETEYVTRAVCYWEELRNIKERAGAHVRLFMAAHENERSAAVKSMRPGASRKLIVIGNGGNFQEYCYFDGRVSRRKSLILRHRLAAPDDSCLDSGRFNLFSALRYTANEIGRKHGWGIHLSAVLPVKGNHRFLAEFKAGNLRKAADELKWQFRVFDSRSYVDAIIFTDDADGEKNGPPFEPDTANSRMPLVGAGN